MQNAVVPKNTTSYASLIMLFDCIGPLSLQLRLRPLDGELGQIHHFDPGPFGRLPGCNYVRVHLVWLNMLPAFKF